MKFEVGPDADSTAACAADHVSRLLAAAVSDRGTASLAVSGGATPRRMFEELAKSDLPWHAIHLFQVDERLAPDGHTERNLTALKEHLLAHIALPAARFHPMPVGLANLADAAERYQRVLRDTCGTPPVIDVVHLGLGRDGHTASLFPGDPAVKVEDTDVTATGEHGGWVRLTLTLPVLRAARHIVWLVTGAEKTGAVRALREGGDILAARVPGAEAVLVADAAATGE